jgi:hypothetical protein
LIEAVESMVKVEEPAPVIEVGLKSAEAPAGRPLASKEMTPVNPLRALVDTVYVVCPPAEMVCEVGEAETEKFGTFATKVTVAVSLRFPLFPVMVNG